MLTQKTGWLGVCVTKKTQTLDNRTAANPGTDSDTRKGNVLKKNLLAKAAATLGGASLIVSGLALPAQADPASVVKFGELSGFGSDTTMDVMDGISAALGANLDGTLKLASYKALGSADVITKVGGTAVPRANGSGAGRDLLRVALGQVSSASVAIAPDELGKARTAAAPTTASVAGLVDFARSSSGPSGAVTNGVVTYVPFAIDNMTYGVSADSKIPNNLPLTDGANPSIANIYNGTFTKVITDSTTGAFIKLAAPGYTVGAGETANTIHAYLPQAGSGTRSFWIGKVSITETQISTAAVPATDVTPSGVSVQEHDGTAVANDPFALMPFSIGQWVAQANGVATDRRHGIVLQQSGSVNPTTVAAGVYSTNAAWATTNTNLKRTVYNIVSTAAANALTDNAVKRAFVGDDSLVCQAKDVITKFGYSLLSYPDTADSHDGIVAGSGATTCGSIVETNRVYAPSASTVAITAGTATNKVTVSASVVSNGDQGGTVKLYHDYSGVKTLVATGTVAKGATTVDIEVANTNKEAGADYSLTAVFLPALSGVASSTSASPVAVSLTAAPADAKLDSTVTASAPVVSADGYTATVQVARVASNDDLPAGVVNILDGATVVGTATIAEDAANVTVSIANADKVASLRSLTAQFVATDSDVYANASSAAFSLALNGYTTATVTLGAKVKKTAKQVITVSIKNGTGAVAATGHAIVVVYGAGKALAYDGDLTAGAFTATLPKLSGLGKYSVIVYYGGSTLNAAVKVTKSFSVVK